MTGAGPLRVVIVKPSKYARDGHVERFRKGFMPNSTLLHLKGLTNLTQISLAYTQVTDVGLAHLEGLTNIGELHRFQVL